MRLVERLAGGSDVEAEDSPSILRRRRVVVGVTIVVGSVLLAATLRVKQGSDSFTVLGLLAAGAWMVGALASGPVAILPKGRRLVARTVVGAVGLGLAAFLVFLVAYLVVRKIPGLSDPLDSALKRADAGSRVVVLNVALLNAIAEEFFFRGAVHAAVGRRRRILTTAAVYTVVTLATGNLALVLAAAVMGSLLGVERHATGSVIAPIATHVTWSTLMILLFPR